MYRVIKLAEKIKSQYKGKCDSVFCQEKFPKTDFRIEELEVSPMVVGGLAIAYELEFVTYCQHCDCRFQSKFCVLDHDLQVLERFGIREDLYEIYLRILPKIKPDLQKHIVNYEKEYNLGLLL